jgi:hypothetical protein
MAIKNEDEKQFFFAFMAEEFKVFLLLFSVV